MLPYYLLTESPGGERALGVAEWSDLLPRSIGWRCIKPLYFSQVAEPKRFALRTIGGERLFDLKLSQEGNRCRVLTEREIASEVKGIDGAVHFDEMTSLLCVGETSIRNTWAPVRVGYSQALTTSQKGAIWELMQRALGQAAASALMASAFIIGSRTYDSDRGKSRKCDIDVAVLCTSTIACRLRSGLALLRQSSTSYVPSGYPFAFPFRVQYAEEVIDLFPCLLDEEMHPLKNMLKWESEVNPRNRRCQVTEVALGNFAWPTYEVTGTPRYIVVLSNGFRGAIAIEDTLDLVVRRTRVISNTAELLVDLVGDPWNNIADASALFAYERDSLWL